MKNNIGTIIEKYARIIILLIILSALALVSENFLKINNLVNVLRQSSMLLIMSLGMTCVMILGKVPDLSIGSTLAFTSCVAAGFLTRDASVGSIIFGLFIALFLGVAIGFINGALISYLKLPAMLVTLGMREIIRGLVYIIMSGKVVTNLHEDILFIGGGRLFNAIPMPIVMAALLTLLTAFILKRTRMGREFYIVGANASAARFSGIKSSKAIISGFVVSGFLAALAGIVYIGRLGTAEGEIGQLFPFNAVGAAAIGGVSFHGGRGSPFGTVIGALIMTLLLNGMNLLNINSLWQGTANGVIIILALLLDNFARKKFGQ